jgi:ubiquinone/menaquinone biosynthesis C-methylase UbiE
VDVVGDVLEVLRALADESVVDVYSSHLFEHIADLPALVTELERVLAVGGRLHVVVPHFSNPYYYSDPTHQRPFGLYTFSYFADDSVLRRRVPTYGHAPRLRLVSARLNFRSAIEFRVRYRLKAALGRVVNASVWLREFYEENLAGIVPCYELEFELVRVA